MLVAHDISVKHGNKTLLQDVSIKLVPGELLVLIGANGAGKSTLLKVLSGDRIPNHGQVLLSGLSITNYSTNELAKKRAVLPQENQLSFPFTTLEVVLMGRYPHNSGHTSQLDLKIARQAMARLDVGHLELQRYPTLSGGERARVQFARVLSQLLPTDVSQQRYLLLDEPTASLDLAHQYMALNAAKQLAHQEGIAVCAVLHDLNLAAQYADRIAILANGQLMACGEPNTILTKDHLDTAFATQVLVLPHPNLDCPMIVTSPAYLDTYNQQSISALTKNKDIHYGH